MTTIAVLKETVKGENRVSLVPESVKRLVKHGLRVLIQDGSGSSAGFRQNAYEEVGATIISQYDDIVNEGDIFLKVNCICLDDGMMDIIDPFPTSSVIIGFFNPFKCWENGIRDPSFLPFGLEPKW